jgi:hypothetical protein
MNLVIGTVGLVERAAELNLLDIGLALGALRRSNAWISKSLIDEALQRHARKVAALTAKNAEITKKRLVFLWSLRSLRSLRLIPQPALRLRLNRRTRT